jgi:hypothetical protein
MTTTGMLFHGSLHSYFKKIVKQKNICFVLVTGLSNLLETQAMKLSILFLFFWSTAGSHVLATNSLHGPVIIEQQHPSVSKKQSPLEKILMKWYKKQLRKKTGLDQPKKMVNTLGYLSLIAGLASPLLLFITGAIASYGFAVFVGAFALALLPTAIILGIISLRKRKKLEDKSGTSAVPAIIGLVAGSVFLIILFIAFLTFSINYSG